MRTLVGWKDRDVQYPNRYQITDAGNGMSTIEQEPGLVTEEGTPQNKTNFGAMDIGILDNELSIRILMQHQKQMDLRVAALEAAAEE